MTVSFYRESAQIIPFPLRKPRFTAAQQAEAEIPDVCAAALDSCWYHTDAIAEASRPAKPSQTLRPVD